MNTLLHAIKAPNIQRVLSGALITHSGTTTIVCDRALLKRLHAEMLSSPGVRFVQCLRYEE